MSATTEAIETSTMLLITHTHTYRRVYEAPKHQLTSISFSALSSSQFTGSALPAAAEAADRFACLAAAATSRRS